MRPTHRARTELSQPLAADFTGHCLLQLPVDSNEDEGAFIYPYFKASCST